MAEIKFSGIVDGVQVTCTITGDDAAAASRVLSRVCSSDEALSERDLDLPVLDDDLREYERDVRRREAFENAPPVSVSGGPLHSQDRALDMLHVGAESAEAFGAGPVVAGEFSFETDAEAVEAANRREELLEQERLNPPGALGKRLTYEERQLLEKIVAAGLQGVSADEVVLGVDENEVAFGGPGALHDRLLHDFPPLIVRGEDGRYRLTAAGNRVCWRQNVQHTAFVEHSTAPS
jgi:hypothetical protein